MPRLLSVFSCLVFTRDPVFWDSVVNTFVYVGGKLILTLPIAFMLAFLLSKSTRINAVSQSIIFTPTIMSSAVMALIFYLLSSLPPIKRYRPVIKPMMQAATRLTAAPYPNSWVTVEPAEIGKKSW